MLTILLTLDDLLLYNILNIVRVFVILIIITLSTSQSHRNGEKRFPSQKLESIFEKYINVVKRYTDEFPNHQIELHLDMTGEDHPKPRNLVRYIHLREPAHVNDYFIGKTEIHGNQMSKPKYFSRTDPDMAPVYMKDLRSAMEVLDKKYSELKAVNNLRVAPTPERDVDNRMKPILDILQKGTLVDTKKETPNEQNSSNMSWLKIKIPKKLL